MSNVNSAKVSGSVQGYLRYSLEDGPHLPTVEDVMRILGISQEKGYIIDLSVINPYVENLSRAAKEAEARGVMELKSFDEKRKLVARVIVDLCPEEARCLFVTRFASAKREAGDDVPGENFHTDAFLYACKASGCKHCKETVRLRATSTD